MTSDDELASIEDLDEAQVDIARTPFRLVPPRLLTEEVPFDDFEDGPQESESTDDLPLESLAEDYHSAVNFPVVEVGTSHDSVDRSRVPS